MKPIKIIVTGASGRMGQTIIKKILINKSLKLIGATEGSKNKFLGSDISALIKSKKTGIIITDKIEPLFAKADAVIDFTIPIATLNYAEMAALIAPRPFMVERGHFDGVAPDETVAYEFAKVRNLYSAKLGIGNKTRIEWFVGPHTIRQELIN